MARARSGKTKKGAKKGAKKRSKKAAAKTRAKPAKRAARRRRPPRVKARTGPVQLWLPLQMPLGLEGGVAVAPTAPDEDARVSQNSVGAAEQDEAGAAPWPSAEQSSLFD